MALLYPWASKEYLLWEMSLGQLFLYHNLGIELKYPSDKRDSEVIKPSEMSYDQLVEYKKKMKEQYGNISGD